MQDQHRESAIEQIVLERQFAGIGVLEGDARVCVLGAGEIEKTGVRSTPVIAARFAGPTG